MAMSQDQMQGKITI